MIDLHMVAKLQHLYIESCFPRHPVKVPVNCGIPVLIRSSFMSKIGGSNIWRQLLKKRLFILKRPCRDHPGFAYWSVGHFDGCPVKCLLVHIFQGFISAAREKIGFYSIKTAFIAGFSIGMPYFMTEKFKSILFCK
jgi:hypothetical protein